jgi:hypothetical protein
VALKLKRIVGLEEDIPDGILAGFRQSAVNVSLSFPLEKLVRDSCHDTCTITITTVSSSSTSVDHRAEQLTSIGDDLVARFTLDVAYETYTARVFLVFVEIKALIGWQRPCPRGRVTFDGIEAFDIFCRSRLGY